VVEADQSCTVHVTTSPLHISTAGSSSVQSGCGSKGQPWSLKAPTGQQIRVHLLDFTATAESWTLPPGEPGQPSGPAGRECRQYGYVTEAGSAARRQTAICGDGERDKLVLQSDSNVLDIVMHGQTAARNNTSAKFMLRFYGNLADLVVLHFILPYPIHKQMEFYLALRYINDFSVK
jgi:hypothetical protein